MNAERRWGRYCINKNWQNSLHRSQTSIALQLLPLYHVYKYDLCTLIGWGHPSLPLIITTNKIRIISGSHRKCLHRCLNQSLLFSQKILATNLVVKALPKLVSNPRPPNHDLNVRCLYCTDSLGNSLEYCLPLNYKIQNLIDVGLICIDPPDSQDSHKNSLLYHNATGFYQYDLSWWQRC